MLSTLVVASIAPGLRCCRCSGDRAALKANEHKNLLPYCIRTSTLYTLVWLSKDMWLQSFIDWSLAHSSQVGHCQSQNGHFFATTLPSTSKKPWTSLHLKHRCLRLDRRRNHPSHQNRGDVRTRSPGLCPASHQSSSHQSQHLWLAWPVSGQLLGLHPAVLTVFVPPGPNDLDLFSPSRHWHLHGPGCEPPHSHRDWVLGLRSLGVHAQSCMYLHSGTTVSSVISLPSSWKHVRKSQKQSRAPVSHVDTHTGGPARICVCGSMDVSVLFGGRLCCIL